MRAGGALVPVVLVALLAAGSIWADVVELKTGRRLEGTFKRATQAGIVIEVEGQDLTIGLEQVRAIYFGAIPPAPVPLSPRREALRAMKALRAVARTGPTYWHYTAEVAEARATVDQYLHGPEQGDAALRGALEMAVRYYVLADAAWKASLTNNLDDLAGLARRPLVQQCREVQEVIGTQAPLMTRYPEAAREGAAVAISGIPALWTCASKKLAEAERLVDFPPGE